MGRELGTLLDNGDLFPVMVIEALEGNRIVLPADLSGKWGVLLFYRGHW